MVMTIEALIIWLVIGAVAGWLAGLIMKGYGFRPPNKPLKLSLNFLSESSATSYRLV
jgi:ribosomal protein L6P/L9E